MLLSATWPYSSYGRNTLPCELSALKETDRSALRELGEVSAATCRAFAPEHFVSCPVLVTQRLLAFLFFLPIQFLEVKGHQC